MTNKVVAFIRKLGGHVPIEERIEKMNTIEELRFALLFFDSIPDTKKIILERWNQLYLPNMGMAILGGDEEFIKVIISPDMPEEGSCVDKAIKYINKNIIPNIKTTNKASSLHCKFRHTPFRPLFDARWKELFLEKLNEAHQPEQFEEASENMYCTNETASLLISKWGASCRNLEDIKKLIRFVEKSGIYLTVEEELNKIILPYIDDLKANGINISI